MVSETAHWVLIAEGDEGVREMVVELLDDRGIQCAEAANADEAIAMLFIHAFDLTVADLSLFAVRREGFLDALASRAPPTKLLLISAGDNTLLDGDGDRFPLLQKPFHTTVFLQTLEQVLEDRYDMPS